MFLLIIKLFQLQHLVIPQLCRSPRLPHLMWLLWKTRLVTSRRMSCLHFFSGRETSCLWAQHVKLSLSPAGSELIQELDSSQSWVVQPAAGLSVVAVGTACQLPSSPHVPAGPQRQVITSPVTESVTLFTFFKLRCMKTTLWKLESVYQSALYSHWNTGFCSGMSTPGPFSHRGAHVFRRRGWTLEMLEVNREVDDGLSFGPPMQQKSSKLDCEWNF